MHDGSGVHITMVQLPGLNAPQFDHCEAKSRWAVDETPRTDLYSRLLGGYSARGEVLLVFVRDRALNVMLSSTDMVDRLRLR